jgi:uncharacterized membrane protein HdeD (DUF308 family)
MQSLQRRRALAIAALGLAGLALIAPLTAGSGAIERIGVLLLLAACVEIAHGFRRRTPASQRSAWLSGGVTLGMGSLLVNAPWFAAGALSLFLAAWFAVDGVRRGIQAGRALAAAAPAAVPAVQALGNVAVAAGLLAFGDRRPPGPRPSSPRCASSVPPPTSPPRRSTRAAIPAAR